MRGTRKEPQRVERSDINTVGARFYGGLNHLRAVSASQCLRGMKECEDDGARPRRRVGVRPSRCWESDDREATLLR